MHLWHIRAVTKCPTLQNTFPSVFSWKKIVVFWIKFVSRGPVDDIPALVQIKAKTKTLSVSDQWWPSLPTHIFVTRSQLFNEYIHTTLVKSSWVIFKEMPRVCSSTFTDICGISTSHHKFNNNPYVCQERWNHANISITMRDFIFVKHLDGSFIVAYQDAVGYFQPDTKGLPYVIIPICGLSLGYRTLYNYPYACHQRYVEIKEDVGHRKRGQWKQTPNWGPAH